MDWTAPNSTDNGGATPNYDTYLASISRGHVPSRPPASKNERMPGTLDEVKSIWLSDKRNAERLQKMYGKRMRHVSGEGWYIWDTSRWVLDDKQAHVRAASIGQVVREELLEYGVSDSEYAKHFYSWARRSESELGVRGTLALAHSMYPFNGDRIEWDADPWILNTPEGVIDLRTGEEVPGGPELYLSKVCPTRYNPRAEAPRFMRFLDEVFQGDAELIDYVQWMCGYALTGCTDHHCFFILFGNGSNGKSVLVDTLRYVMGSDYFHTMTADDLLQHRNSRHLSPIAQLQGKRLVVASETSDEKALNTSLVKQLTAGDAIRANLMRQDATEFNAVLKLWLMTNFKPDIHDNSTGMWRRLRLIPFLASFEGDNEEVGLKETLKGEAEGIFAWMIEGAKRVADGEPKLPTKVREATEEYRAEEDMIGQFIDERIEFIGQSTVKFPEMFKAWQEFSPGSDLTQIKLGKALNREGLTKRKAESGWYWEGVFIKPTHKGADRNDRN